MDSVIIVPYDAEWPTRFARERKELEEIFRGVGAVIEHVGSTAVPGLGAKPIIDILLGVTSLSEVESRIPQLEGRGFEYVAEYESELPERRYFRKPQVGPRTVHLHCVVCGGEFWVRHLAFRDHLRTHANDASAYFDLKRKLAARHTDDRSAYTDAKSDFIQSIVENALAQESDARTLGGQGDYG